MPIMRRSRGFTLIELLVVIAVIALLLAILMPALQRVKNQARTVACQANLHQWALIWAMYTEDNGGHFPTEVLLWRDFVEEYHKEKDITLCPVATKLYTDGARPPFGAWEQTWGQADRDAAGRPFASSYGLNQWVLNASSVVGGRTLDYLWRTTNVRGASEVMFFGDCAITGATPLATDEPPGYDGDCANVWGSGGSTNEMRRFCMNRHDWNMNGLFLDSSVRKVGLKELWTLRWHRQFNTMGHWTKAGSAQPEDWPQWMRNLKDY
jgi:prepilin-type N-terminal cleavage/methylation domain-containing protein